MSVSVIITSYNDPRIELTLSSLYNQSTLPDEVLVADGGSTTNIKSICERYKCRFEVIPGNIPQTRSVAIFRATGSIIVFIDTDEVAPRDWLSNLIDPITKGEADFTGGPARHYSPKTQAECYVNLLEDEMYRSLISKDIRYLPMGNSAWRREIFKKIGTFNIELLASEDYDINMRAVKAGFKGKFIPDAWVYHDHSDINTIGKLLHKRYKYLRDTAKVYKMQNMFWNRLSIARKRPVRHPFYVIEELLKPVALLDALIRD
ncbi:glycosyltransferase [Thermoplasmatales archaeon AK]|nr:glycosyltransferase [Thermoplasmatales archaeon AK]